MKYNININQLFFSDFEELDIKDMAIFDYMWTICASVNAKIEKERYAGHTWINYEKLIDDMPALRIKSRNSVTPRITKLEKSGLFTIKRRMIKGNRRVFVKPTTLAESVFISTNTRVHSDDKRVRETVQDNNTIDNSIKDTSEETSQGALVNKYIKILEPLNPVGYTKWFSDLTQRKNVELLMKKIKPEEMIKLVKFICLNQGKEFFPSISTPLQLVNKLPNLQKYFTSKGYKKKEQEFVGM